MQNVNRLTIELRSEYADGTNAVSSASITLPESDIDFDPSKIACGVAQAIGQHVGNPLKFLAHVIQNVDVHPGEWNPEDWRRDLLKAANAAPVR